MHRFAQLLKNLFVPTEQQSLSGTGGELTLHDVLRICAARAPQRPRPVLAATGYQLVANSCWEGGGKSPNHLHRHTFGGRLAAYGTEKCDSRFALMKRQAP